MENRRLRNEDTLMYTIIDRMDAMVRVIDGNDQVLYMNEKMRQRFGERCGEKCYETLAHQRKCKNCVTQRSRGSGIAEHKESVVDGRTYRIIASSVQLTGARRYYIEFFVDITEQKALEESNRQHFVRLKQDVEFARQVQYNALPKDGQYYESITLHSIYRPAESLAGDFFDVVAIDKERLLFYIADVSGHGVKSSLLTIFLRQVIRGMKEEAGDYKKLINGILQGLNDLHAGGELYLTIAAGIYNKKSRELTLVNAGHNCLPVLEEPGKAPEEIPVYGMPICSILKEVNHRPVTKKIKPKSRMLLYTDGITEAEDQDGNPFGFDGLMRLWNSQQGKSPQRIMAALQAKVVEFSAFLPTDDMTATLIEFL